MDVVYRSIDFYKELKSKYPDYLKSGIISVVLVQSEEEVWLETTEV